MNSSHGLQNKRVLVTGGSGFLGSHLIYGLCENGSEVHAVSRVQRNSDTNGPSWWQGDMADIATVRSLLRAVKPEVIFHLSGLAVGNPNLDLVLPTFHSLLTSTVNILTVASEMKGCRVVLTGSLTEPCPPDATPGSPYAAAKLSCVTYGRMFYHLFDLSVVIVRIFMTYGPKQNLNKLIPSVILQLLRGESPKLSSGLQQFDWIYVEDVIEGILRAGQVPDLGGSTIDLGSGVAVSVRTIVQKLTQLVGTPIEPLYGALADRPFEKTRIANIAESYAKLGWKPKTPLQKGLELTVDWNRKNLFEDLTSRRPAGERAN